MPKPVLSMCFSARHLRRLCLGCLMLLVPLTHADEYLVTDPGEYRRAMRQLQPGDSIVLRSGEWRDFDLLFRGEGTADRPITLRAEKPGGVELTGSSSLRLAGRHLVVRGLVFRDGYAPRSAVISFRADKGDLAYYSRVTETVIDNYSNPERYETDYWVAIYGQHNRFDHNHLEGKGNRGVTLAVRLDSKDSRDNHHRIDHNYFGPRPLLGANGGETLRVGTSHYSMYDSSTVVENNYFDRCNGELEIISNKSGGNVFRGNVFHQSRGTLTLRHGHGNVLENNVFVGEGAPHSGGIRVINRDQTVRNNYLEGLRGNGFGSAFTVMNGVPNSPVNRYHQVVNAHIYRNTIVNSSVLLLAGGSDAERSAVPKSSVFDRNIVFTADGSEVFRVLDDVSGIAFRDNLVSAGVGIPEHGEGTRILSEMERGDNGLLYPVGSESTDYGVSTDLKVLSKVATGVSWYPKPGEKVEFGSGPVVDVPADGEALLKAIADAAPGSVLHLRPGNYHLGRMAIVDKPITIQSNDGKLAKEPGARVKVTYERSALFEIVSGGGLRLAGLHLSGESAPDTSGNSVVRTSRYSMLGDYSLLVEDCLVTDLDINRDFTFLRSAKSTFAYHIKLKSSRFEQVSGSLLQLDEEDDDLGRYNAEYVTISDSEFENISGPVLSVYRGGTDESTFGPHVSVESSVFREVGLGKRNKRDASLYLHGAQDTIIRGNHFEKSAPLVVEHTVGKPLTRILSNIFDTAPQVSSVVERNPVEAVFRENEIRQ